MEAALLSLIVAIISGVLSGIVVYTKTWLTLKLSVDSLKEATDKLVTCVERMQTTIADINAENKGIKEALTALKEREKLVEERIVKLEMAMLNILKEKS